MRTRLAPLALAAVAACSGGVDPAALDPYADNVRACRATFDAILSRADRCGIATPLAERLFGASAFVCEGLNRPTVGHVEERLRACAEAMAELPCWAEDPEVCDDPFSGTVGENGECVSDADCRPELAGCYSTPGTCGGVCRAYGETGARCDVVDPPCGAGLFCNLSTELCEPLRQRDALCSQPDQCADGLTCMGASCQPVAGNPCTVEYDCATRDWQYYCPVWEPFGSLSRTCRQLGTVEADADRCGGGKNCPGDQWCDSGTCKPRLLSGSCEQSFCLAPSVCFIGGGSYECRPPVKIGGACLIGSGECELGAYCGGPEMGQQGVCRAWPGPGEDCGSLSGEWVECLDGWCKQDDASPSGRRCAPYSQLGDTCISNIECGPGDELAPRTCDAAAGICVAACPR